MDKLRFAMVGCGAVAETHHLPALASCERVTVAMLVDTFMPRARQLADKYGVPACAGDYRDIIGKVDAAIVALPNSLHASVTTDLLQHGIHVLVEKPMGLSAAECDTMLRASARAERTLAVGLVLRFFYASQFVKSVLERGWLGKILTVDLRHGAVLSWPLRSDYLVRKETAGGGVLADFGAHTLDLLLWWLGDYAGAEYYDDAMGGVEADCELRLEFQGGGVGRVEMSRIRELKNTCIIQGEHGEMEIPMLDPNAVVRLRVRDHDLSLLGRVAPGQVMDDSFPAVMRRQLDDFVDAVLNHRDPFVSGKEARRSVALVETCYASRQTRLQPWMSPDRADVAHGR